MTAKPAAHPVGNNVTSAIFNTSASSRSSASDSIVLPNRTGDPALWGPRVLSASMIPDSVNVGVLAADGVGAEGDNGAVGWVLLVHASVSRIAASTTAAHEGTAVIRSSSC